MKRGEGRDGEPTSASSLLVFDRRGGVNIVQELDEYVGPILAEEVK